MQQQGVFFELTPNGETGVVSAVYEQLSRKKPLEAAEALLRRKPYGLRFLQMAVQATAGAACLLLTALVLFLQSSSGPWASAVAVENRILFLVRAVPCGATAGLVMFFLQQSFAAFQREASLVEAELPLTERSHSLSEEEVRTRGIRQARAASFVFALLATECWVLLFLMAGGMYSAAAALFAVPATVALRAKLKATLEDRGSEGEGRRTERAILNLTTGPSFFGIADVGESRRRSGVSFDVSEGDEEAAAFADSPAALLAGDARRSADSTDRSLSQCALRGLLRWADGVSFFFVCGLLLLTTLEVKGGQFLVVAAPFLSACCCAFCWSSAVASRVVSKLNRQLSAKDRAQGLALFAPLHQRLLFSAPMDSCDTAAPLSSQLSSNSFDDALPLPVQLPPGEAFLEQAHFHNPQQTSDRCAFGNIHLGGNGGGLRTHFPREAVGFSDGQKASFFSNSPPEEPSPSSAAASGASARRGPNAKRTADWRVDGEEENKGQRNTSGCSQDSQDSARMQRREGRGNGDCFSNRHVSPASSEEERRSREEERGKREEKHHRQDRLAGHPEGRGTPENPSLDDSPYTRM